MPEFLSIYYLVCITLKQILDHSFKLSKSIRIKKKILIDGDQEITWYENEEILQRMLSRRKQIEKKGKREFVHELMQHSNG